MELSCTFSRWNIRVLWDVSLSFTSSINYLLLSILVLKEFSSSFFPLHSHYCSLRSEPNLFRQVSILAPNGSSCFSLPFFYPSSTLSSKMFLKPTIGHVNLQWLLRASRMHLFSAHEWSFTVRPEVPLSTTFPTFLGSSVCYALPKQCIISWICHSISYMLCLSSSCIDHLFLPSQQTSKLLFIKIT